MIARIWHGRTPDSLGEEYFDYIKRTGVRALRASEGNRWVYVLKRVENGVSEFGLITLWDSLEAIKKFAGPDFEKAVYFPDDEKYLLELEPCVRHFDVLLASKGYNSYNEGSLPKLMRRMKGIRI